MDDFLNQLKTSNKNFSEDYQKMIGEYYKKLMNNPAELQNVLNMLGQGQGKQNGVDNEGGITITPDKYCCIKTFDETGQKVFINLVSSEHVDPPQEQHILEMDNQHGIRIPMSLSEPYEDSDKNGNPCQVYDAIFNPGILKKTESEPMLMQFIIGCIAGRAKERFKRTFDTRRVIKLQNLIYKGKAVRTQRIRARKVKIDEIINNTNEKDKQTTLSASGSLKTNEINKEVHEKGKTPNWNFIVIKVANPTGKMLKTINAIAKDKIVTTSSNGKINYEILNSLNEQYKDMFEFYNGFNANPQHGYGLLLIVELELLGKSSGIKLNLSDERFTLYCGKFYSLELNLPYVIESKRAKAMFVAESRLLYVYLPFYEKEVVYDKNNNNNAQQNENTKVENVLGVTEDYLFDVV
jgi:hypothetical protein